MPESTLDRLRAAIADPARLAPASRTAGARLVEVGPGHAVATVASAEVLPALGSALVLADFLLGAVVGTCLPPGRRVSTLSLHASVTAPGTGALTATARLGHLGTTAVSHAEVCDAAGAPVATLSSRCAVLPASGPPPVAESAPAALALHVAPGVASATADPGLANFGSTVQGGVLATVLAHALDAAAGGVELDVTFLRPVPTDGTRFTARATPVHAGTRFAAGRAELRDARDRLAAIGVAGRWLGD